MDPLQILIHVLEVVVTAFVGLVWWHLKSQAEELRARIQTIEGHYGKLQRQVDTEHPTKADFKELSAAVEELKEAVYTLVATVRASGGDTNFHNPHRGDERGQRRR